MESQLLNLIMVLCVSVFQRISYFLWISLTVAAGKPEARQHVDQMETQVPEESADATDLDKEMAALEEREHGVEAGARAGNRMQQISDHRVEIP